MPSKTPGLIEDLKSGYIDTSMVGKVVAVSAVSLIGGASLGPEVALGQMGGGTGCYIAERRNLDDDARKEHALSGMAGAFGGLFSSSLMATILVLEISAPPRSRSGSTFFASIVSSSVSLGLYFAIAGSVFLGLYEVPQYEYEDWNLLVGFGLGLLSVVVVLLTFAVVAATKRLISGLNVPSLLLPVIGGLLFGLVGWALPLTNFTGSDQLDTVLQNGSALGDGIHRGTDLPNPLHRWNHRHHREPDLPRDPARSRLHLHAGGGPGIDRRGPVLAGAPGRDPHSGGGASDVTDRDCGCDVVPHGLAPEVRGDPTAIGRRREQVTNGSVGSIRPLLPWMTH